VDDGARLEVGDRIGARRVATVPCFYCETAGCCELLERRPRGPAVYERVLCTATWRTFRRVWVCR